MITTAGARLSKSERADTRRKLDDVMRMLERLTADQKLAVRVRFIIKDVLVGGALQLPVRVVSCCAGHVPAGWQARPLSHGLVNVGTCLLTTQGPALVAGAMVRNGAACLHRPVRRKHRELLAAHARAHGAQRLTAAARTPRPQDLRRCNWVPRREVFTAKKLDEIRGQAEAELGMISTNIAASLPTLPSQQRAGSGARVLQAGTTAFVPARGLISMPTLPAAAAHPSSLRSHPSSSPPHSHPSPCAPIWAAPRHAHSSTHNPVVPCSPCLFQPTPSTHTSTPTPTPAGGAVGDMPLLPPLRSEAEGWVGGLFPPMRPTQGAGRAGGGAKSALLGEWQPTPMAPTQAAR